MCDPGGARRHPLHACLLTKGCCWCAVDNVTLHLDGVLYVKITDPYQASYGVEDPEYAVAQLAQTTMRSELGATWRCRVPCMFRTRQR